jgi:Rad3-related DNA helicase
MDYETMQTIVQASGRGSRHFSDHCVVMITDDAIDKLRRYAKKHAPKWYTVLDAPGGKVPRAPR